MMNTSSDQRDESVEDLLKKLAKKGKKVKLLDETASVKELPKQEDADGIEEEPDLNRREEEEEERMNDSVDEIDEE
jgi:fructoselysine-6-P-deglycase FrlB-like protein